MRFHSRERLFEVVGFDAADVVRRGCVQGLHEQLQRTAKLNQTQVREKHHVVPQGGARPCELTWCPTVFRWSLFEVLGVDFIERTFTLDDLAAGASSFSWNRSATSWNWKSYDCLHAPRPRRVVVDICWMYLWNPSPLLVDTNLASLQDVDLLLVHRVSVLLQEAVALVLHLQQVSVLHGQSLSRPTFFAPRRRKDERFDGICSPCRQSEWWWRRRWTCEVSGSARCCCAACRASEPSSGRFPSGPESRQRERGGELLRRVSARKEFLSRRWTAPTLHSSSSRSRTPSLASIRSIHGWLS